MLKLETAIERAFWRVNDIGETCDVWGIIWQYKAIRQLPDEEQEKIYDDICSRAGFCR